VDEVEIDRALHAMLSEEPSPEFVARVRTTLAGAPRPSMMSGWFMPVAAIACAAVVAIAVGWPRESPIAPVAAGLKPSTTYAPSTTTVVVPTFRSAGPAVGVPTFRSAKTTKPAARAMASIPNEPPFPEVIIAADDVEALRQFVSGARDRRFVATFEEAPTPVAWAVNDLAIAPITVEPLDSTQSHNN
jgi:hypothetical protein